MCNKFQVRRLEIMSNQEPTIERLWAELAKYDIYTEEQLNAAIAEMEPLDISCMVSKVDFSKQLEEK